MAEGVGTAPTSAMPILFSRQVQPAYICLPSGGFTIYDLRASRLGGTDMVPLAQIKIAVDIVLPPAKFSVMRLWLTALIAVSLMNARGAEKLSADSGTRDQRLAKIEATPASQLTDSDWVLVLREARTGNGARFISLFSEILKQHKSSRFNDVLYLLGEMGEAAKPVVPSLVAVLKDGDEDARYNIAEAIGKMGPAASEAVPALIQSLSIETSRGPKIALTEALGLVGKASKDALTLLVRQQNDKDTMISAATVNALARISDEPEPFVKLLIRDADVPQEKNVVPLWACEALETFAAIGPAAESALPVIVKNLGHPSETMREHAVRAAGAMGPKAKSAIPILERTASDTGLKESLRISAARAIGNIENRAAEVEARIATIKAEVRKAEEDRWAKLNASVAQYTSQLPPVTRVEINVIRSADVEPQGKRRGPTFPIRPYGTERPVASSQTLERAEAERVAASWRKLEFGWQFQAMCHEPVYGLRFYAGRKLLLETSICWECDNFYLPKGWFGFNGKAESGQSLLKLLDSILPYERPTTGPTQK